MYSYDNVNDFVRDYRSGKISFPYIRLDKTDEDVREMFKNLKKIKFDDRVCHNYYKIHNIKIPSSELLYLGNPVILTSKPNDYVRFNMLSDMFQEKNRIKCKFFSAQSSPLDYFNRKLEKLAKQVLLKGPITNTALSDELYNSIKFCSAFRPANLMYIAGLFNAKSILDPCSGWGDRLIGAMALGATYVGVDPNHELHPVYQEMIKFFMNKNDAKKYTMIESTIQDAILPKRKFDLVFTSPPYFKIEQYNNKGRVKDSDEHTWFDTFMKPMINKTSDHLKNGGHLVLVINQLKHEQYIQNMLDYIKEKKDLHFLGVISYGDRAFTNPQPMWIWLKSKKPPRGLG